ncbi:MAG: DUF2934 domain-containing protein [Hyphomicrobiales bacterium]
MPVQKSAVQGSREEQIKALAYRFWLEEGQPDGRADIHWFKAVTVIEGTAAPARKPRARAAAAPRTTPRKGPRKSG